MRLAFSVILKAAFGAGPFPSTISAPAGTAFSAGSFTGNDEAIFVNSALEGFPACSISASLAGQVQRIGNNASNDTSCGFIEADDVENQPLMLAPPEQLDGTLARTPQRGSPLIDAGDDGTCLYQDQRKAPRPEDGDGDGAPRCDIGAIEVPEPMGGVWTGIALLAHLTRVRQRDRRGEERAALAEACAGAERECLS
jgi:hypothetical protein